MNIADVTMFVIVLTIYCISEVIHYIEKADWKEERQQLLDRIQASNFIEYKEMTNNEPRKEKKEDKEEKHFDYL